MRVVQAFTREQREHRNFREISDRLPAGEPADGRPERPLLPVRRPALDDRARGRARLRRPPVLPGRADDRHALRLHALRPELLRPRPGALAALRHVPLGDGRARQDHRRPRRGARGGRPRRARATCPRSRGDVRFEGVRFSYGRGDEVLHGIDLDVPAGHDGRARRPHRRGQVDDREAARPLLRPDARADHDRRRSTSATSPRRRSAASSASCRRRASSSPARVRENIAFGEPDATAGADRRRRAGGRRARLRPAARGRLRDRARRARAAALARPAAARRLRARAARRPAHPRPRRGDVVGRHRHRAADRASRCARCSPAGPRSSSRTASRRSATPT